MAAVLACGPEAVLSHHAAAALWKLLPPPHGPVDVTVRSQGGRKKRAGIRLHRSTSLTQRETTLRRSIPVTNPTRTLMDLQRCVSPQDQARARRQAEVLGYPIDETGLGKREPTRSELERRFLRLCRRHRLPSPEVNAAVGTHIVDFLWRDSRLIVETDGYRYHRGRAAFEHDHRRQARLAAAGYEVLRFTWRQVIDEPDQVITTVRTRLAGTPTQPLLGAN